MNKQLFEKVKALCKDKGLSEKYLTAITEKMGVSIKDDSTDETAIEDVANLIADVAGETQSEATRWANTKKEPKEPKEPKDPKDPKDPKEPKNPKEPDDEKETRIKEMEEKLAKFEAEQAKKTRDAAVQAAISKHKIPEWRTKGLVVPDEEDPDAYMAAIRQDLITQKLVPADSEGVKTVSEKQVDEAADSLLESITVK